MSDQAASADLVPTVPMLSDDQLASIESFDQALDLASDLGPIIPAEKVVGTGFAILENKQSIVGVPFIVVKVEFWDSAYAQTNDEGEDSTKFVSVHLVTRDGRKLIVNDGSHGLYLQLHELYSRKPELLGKALMVRKGLKRRDYVHDEFGPVTVYALDTSGE